MNGFSLVAASPRQGGQAGRKGVHLINYSAGSNGCSVSHTVLMCCDCAVCRHCHRIPAHYHIYSHVKKYANAKTVLANHYGGPLVPTNFFSRFDFATFYIVFETFFISFMQLFRLFLQVLLIYYLAPTDLILVFYAVVLADLMRFFWFVTFPLCHC